MLSLFYLSFDENRDFDEFFPAISFDGLRLLPFGGGKLSLSRFIFLLPSIEVFLFSCIATSTNSLSILFLLFSELLRNLDFGD